MNLPMVGIRKLQEIEKEHIKDVNLFERTIDNTIYDYFIEKNEIKYQSISNDKVKFNFYDVETIKPNTITLNLRIKNPNKDNYLQIDGTLDSFIKSIKWFFQGKIIEEINDYNIIRFFMNDMNYIPNEKNALKELNMPLTIISREDVIEDAM